MSASLYQFIPAAELAHHLRRDISSAKRRVYLRTMAFGDSGAIHDITQLLIGKAGEALADYGSIILRG